MCICLKGIITAVFGSYETFYTSWPMDVLVPSTNSQIYLSKKAIPHSHVSSCTHQSYHMYDTYILGDFLVLPICVLSDASTIHGYLSFYPSMNSSWRMCLSYWPTIPSHTGTPLPQTQSVNFLVHISGSSRGGGGLGGSSPPMLWSSSLIA